MQKLERVKTILVALSILMLFSIAARSATNGRIAFTYYPDGNREIYSIEADGSGLKRLTYNPGVDDYAAWSPDGKMIAYLSQEISGQYLIRVMSADGDQPRTVSPVVFDIFAGGNYCNEQFAISWSPDGKRIAFQEFGDIVSINVDGTDRRTIGANSIRESEPAFTPTGVLAYTLTLQGGDGINGLQIGTTEGELYADYGYHTCSYSADWSPDGTKLAYVHSADFPPPGHVVIVPTSGPGYYRALNNLPLGMKPKWSPDGQFLAYASCRFNICESFDISIIDELGQSRRTLIEGGTNPSWQRLVDEFSISGRVLTPGGQGLRNAIVSLIDAAGAERRVTSSSFGFYAFEEVRRGETYMVSVSSKRYRFTPRSIQVNGNLSGVDLVGQE